MPSTPVSKPRSKRVRRSPAQARQLILETAVREFSKHGPASVGLKDIARAAGVSHALITHYFGTSEALVEAAVEQSMTTLRTRLIDRLLATPNPTPEAMVELYLDIALEPWYGRLISWVLFSERESSTFLSPRLIADMKLIVGATEQMLRERVQPPPTRRQAEALVISLWSIAAGYVAANNFMWRALGQKPGPARDRDLRESVVALTRSLFER